MNRFLTFLFVLVLLGCKSTKVVTKKTIKLKFLDEYVLPDSLRLDSTLIGGLSGIDYNNGMYYLVCDDASNPRYYKAQIDIKGDSIHDIYFTDVYFIKDSLHFLDLEAIRYNPGNDKVVITSEGNIRRGMDPTVFTIDKNGKIENLSIPDYFAADSPKKPRNNGIFEGLCLSYYRNGYWVGMELPLEADGPEPALDTIRPPVRITYLEEKDNKPVKQFVYRLEPITKKPNGPFAVNGLTDLLQYAPGKFYIIERAFSSGWGSQGNTVRIFNVDASNATNTLAIDNLQKNAFVPAKKNLLFDFESVRDRLTKNIVDNIEGMTFGPTLSNGNQTLLLVADNNFNQLGEQLNQFILLEIIR